MTTHETAIDDARARRRFFYLLLTLVLLCALEATLPSGLARRILLEVMTFATIAVGSWVISGRAPAFRIALFLMLATLTLLVLRIFFEDVTLMFIRDLALVAALGLFAFYIVRLVLTADMVTHDTILGAVCGYLLVGLAWAYGYSALAIFDSNAFTQVHESVDLFSSRQTPDPMIYFSFVTMSTLGYGDIAPVSPTARLLCWTEAVFGQIYLAALVGRLVGLQLQHGGSSSK